MDTEAKEETEKMNRAVATQYDVQSKIIEEITAGDHFHVGFYDSSSVIPGSDVHSAQNRLIEAALCFASLSGDLIHSSHTHNIRTVTKVVNYGFVAEDPRKKPKSILDVGCGIGGTTRYLASKFGAQCKGITISPFEAERARLLTAAKELESQVSFEVADALNQPFPDGQFDLIWCVECADHINDKTKLVHEFARVAAPGATIVIITWCHRDLSPLEQDLHPDEKKFLNETGKNNHSSSCSPADFIDALKSCSLEDIKYADWSPHIAPFYSEMRKLMLSWRGIMSYVRHAGWKQLDVRALGMPSPLEIRNRLFKYCIFTCQKPA